MMSAESKNKRPFKLISTNQEECEMNGEQKVLTDPIVYKKTPVIPGLFFFFFFLGFFNFCFCRI
jgi:hypothetical protein